MSQNVPKGFWKCPSMEDCVFLPRNTTVLEKDEVTPLCTLPEKCSQCSKWKINERIKDSIFVNKQAQSQTERIQMQKKLFIIVISGE